MSSANVISCSVGCESISFQGTITEDCRFFSHPSNHNIWIKSLCAAQHTVPESKHISRSVLWSCDTDVYDKLFPIEKKLFANHNVCFNLPQFKTTAEYSFSSLLWVNKYHSWPLWTLTWSVYIVGAGKSNNTRDGWEIKLYTFSHYSHEECRPHSDGHRLDSRSLVGPTLTVISGLRIGMRQAGRREGYTRSHASTVKEADQVEVVQLSLTWRCHSSTATSNWRKGSIHGSLNNTDRPSPIRTDCSVSAPSSTSL